MGAFGIPAHDALALRPTGGRLRSLNRIGWAYRLAAMARGGSMSRPGMRRSREAVAACLAGACTFGGCIMGSLGHWATRSMLSPSGLWGGTWWAHRVALGRRRGGGGVMASVAIVVWATTRSVFAEQG